jgi:hypothetical protein
MEVMSVGMESLTVIGKEDRTCRDGLVVVCCGMLGVSVRER